MSVKSWLKSALKAVRFPGYGGIQGANYGWTSSDWWWSRGRWTGSAYDYTQSVGRLGENTVVAACVAWMQRACTEPPVMVVAENAQGEENPVPDHPILPLLRRPNPHITGRNLWQAVISDWLLTGNAYLYKERNAGGQVLALYHYPQYTMFPQWNDSGREFIGRYLHRVDGKDDYIQPRDVVHFRFGQHPDNTRLGWAPILAGLREVAALNEGANYKGALLRNRATPSAVISSKDPSEPLTPEQRATIEANWVAKTSGDGAGRPIFLTMPVDIQKPGYSPAELALGEMLNWDADGVCSLFGLSSLLVGVSSGSEHKTYANYAEAREAGMEQAVIPLLTDFGATLDLQLLPDFGDPESERVRWDLTRIRILQEDENAKWERIAVAVKDGRMARNEARALMSLAPVADPSYDLPQPLLMTGFPWDQPPSWVPEPEPVAPPFEEGEPPESSGDRAVTAEQPEPAANGNGARQ
jgi:HK97 family phage portal protein